MKGHTTRVPDDLEDNYESAGQVRWNHTNSPKIGSFEGSGKDPIN